MRGQTRLSTHDSEAITSSHLFPFFLLQTGRSENVVQGLSLCGGHVGVPEVHHEDHPGPVVCGAYGIKHKQKQLTASLFSV